MKYFNAGRKFRGVEDFIKSQPKDPSLLQAVLDSGVFKEDITLFFDEKREKCVVLITPSDDDKGFHPSSLFTNIASIELETIRSRMILPDTGDVKLSRNQGSLLKNAVAHVNLTSYKDKVFWFEQLEATNG